MSNKYNVFFSAVGLLSASLSSTCGAKCDAISGSKATLIVKYGGSAITDKSTFEALDDTSLSIAANQLKKVQNEHRWSQIVLVHGAGSFGHFQAKQYGLKGGGVESTNTTTISNDNTWQKGLTLTRQSVLKLNKAVVDAHVTVDLPVTTVSPFPTTITAQPSSVSSQVKLSSADTTTSINPSGSRIVHPGSLNEVGAILSAGMIPVLHGDVVLDKSQRCAILGGDHIIYW
jgi:isopentenyl phosphate kinase